MPRSLRSLLSATLCWALVACASAVERGEALYRQGDVGGALEIWRTIPASSGNAARAQTRIEAVESEILQGIVRYEKRAEFFEGEGRLAEAVLYYRLALKLDPGRSETLARVQTLYREQRAREAAERDALANALARGDLLTATRHADELSKLNPFDPGVQIELRQVLAEAGAQALRALEEGKRAYAAGERASARSAFERVVALDPDNDSARGYLSFIARYDDAAAADAAKRASAPLSPPPLSVSREELRAEGRYGAGRAAETANNPCRAIAEYEAALRAQEKHVGARRRLTELRSEQAARAAELYEKGKRHFQDEDLEQALVAWRCARLIAPGDQRTRESIERAEKILSRLEEIQSRGP